MNGRKTLLGCASIMLCLLGGVWPAPAAPDPVQFPAAANIHPNPTFIGPVRIDPTPSGVLGPLNPEDTVVFNPNNLDIDVINSQGSTAGTGTRTVVASSSVGTGTSFSNPVNLGVVSPQEQLYYWDSTALSFYRIDLTSSSYPRAKVVSPASNSALPIGVGGTTSTLCWDFANNNFLYFENGAGTSAANGSTIARGIYRFTPSTTAASTNVLVATIPSSLYCHGLAVKQDGTIFALLDNNSYTAAQINRIDSSASQPRVDGTAGTYTGFESITGVSWDFTNQRILVFDQAQSQTNAKIISLDPATGTRTLVSSGNSASGAYGGSYINGPSFGFRNTANRILYTDFDVATFTKVMLSTVPPGSTTASQYYTGPTASGSNGQYADGGSTYIVRIPPSQAIITSLTATSGAAGTSATLGATVTSPGTALVAPTVQTRGIVYSLASTNSNPQIGGTGVTQLASTAATGTYTVSATGLTAGTTYAYAGYVSTYYGLVYTAVGTFTTASAPMVTTNTAANITGTTATLGGNVTSDGGSTITARGVVYSPTATNNAPVIGATGAVNVTASGTTGVFTVSATGLNTGTQYSYRAYATNGVGTTYVTPSSTFTTVAPPTANSQSVSVAFNTATAVTLTGSDPNNPAQTLTYSITNSPAHGTLSGTAPNLTYTPTTGYNGTDSFQFTTTNTSGLTSNTATVTLTVAKGTPTANSQSVSVAFNTATAITLSASDPDSPALTLTYTVVTAPTHGTLSGTAPNLTYTPTANYQGADSFTFRVSNGTNTSNTATVSLTVAAGTPTATSQSVSTSFNAAAAITLTGTDPDSPALTLTYTVATAPSHGTLSGTAPNLTYTPTANYQGSDSFTFTVSNGQKTSTAATVSITVAAGTPTATSQSVNVNLNLPKTITLTGTDPDSPALSLTYTVITQPTNGTLSGTAPNLTYTPNSGYTGSDSFTFTVSNGQKTSSAATVSLTVIGQPTISSFTPASGPVGTVVTITGTNLQNAISVNFLRNVAGTNFTIVSSTQVTVRVPAGATTGTLTVLSGSGSNSSSTKFTVTP